jgi:putative CocE/NonD family hydrolase
MAAQMSHTTYDDFWRQLAADEHIEKITIPVYYTSGWHDRYPHVVTSMFNNVRTRGGSPLARKSVKLMIGPWTHGGSRSGQRVVGDKDFGEQAAINYAALQVRWFDHHLRSVDTGIMGEPPVRIFVMGTNEWRSENEWPIARATPSKFYLRSTKSGSAESLNDGTLSPEAPGPSEQSARFTFDPKDPVLSIGGDLFVAPAGVQDHRPADRRSLTFTTAPVTQDTEVSGPSEVELYASSSADDTDFVVTLIDVHPNGYSQLLRQNVLRASRRESLEKPTAIQPGKVYKLTIPIFPIGNVFKQGHRIRLTVSSSSFPKWMPNHNKFMLDNEQAPFVVAENTIYLDAKRPSTLTLPIIPPKAMSRK